MHKHISLSLVSLGILGILFVTPVSAQDTTVQEQQEQIQNNRESLQQDIEENRQQRQEVREENVEQRCTIAETRTDTIISKYDDQRLRYVERYSKLITKLNNLVEVLNDRGVDTSSLVSYINEMQGLETQFSSEIDAAIEDLRLSTQYICGQSEGSYVSALSDARQDMLDARTIAVQINNIYLTEIVPELQSIRDSLRS